MGHGEGGARIRLPLALLAATLVAAGCSVDVRSSGLEPLAEGWQYRWGDSPRESGTLAWLADPWNAEGWSETRMPASPPSRDGARYLWLRTRLPAAMAGATHLYLPLVDENVEVYVDGTLVHRFGDIEAGEVWEGSPIHIVPLGARPEGKLLALRIFSRHMNLGVSGTPLLGTDGAIVRHVVRTGWLRLVVGIALLALALAGGAVLAFTPSDRSLRFFTALTAACGVYAVTCVFSPVKHLLTDRTVLVWYLEFASLYLIPVSYFGFYETIAPASTRRLVRWLWRGLAAFALTSLAGGMAGLWPLPDTLGAFYALLFSALVLGIFLAGRAALRGSHEARVYLVGLLAVVLTSAHDVLVAIRVLSTDASLVVWGFVVFIACIAHYIIQTQSRLVRERDGYSRQLEEANRAMADARARIAETAGRLSARAADILATATRHSGMVSQQSVTNRETHVTVTTIAQASQSAAGSASTVVETAGQSEALSREGEQTVGQAVAAMEELSRQVAAMEERVNGLSKRTREIGEIIATVREIADRSNLLALNAAIEASRAEDDAQGFALVAGEMRALAVQSKTGAERVRRLLGEIDQGAREAVEATAAGSASASHAVELAHEAGRAISSLGELIADSSRIARQIAERAEAQSRGVELVVEAIAESSTALDDSVEETRRLQEAARALSELATGLAELARAGDARDPVFPS